MRFGVWRFANRVHGLGIRVLAKRYGVFRFRVYHPALRTATAAAEECAAEPLAAPRAVMVDLAAADAVKG